MPTDPHPTRELPEAERLMALIERAEDEVSRICREGPRNGFRMSIPVNIDRDSDIILSDGLKAGAMAVKRLSRAEAVVVAARGLLGCYTDRAPINEEHAQALADAHHECVHELRAALAAHDGTGGSDE